MRFHLALVYTALLAGPAAAAEGANPFVGTIYQAIAAAVVFVTVMVVLKKAAWGKILQGLQDRENRIKHDLDQAEASAKQAEKTLAEYQKLLANAQEEARSMMESCRADAKKVSAELKDQAQTEIDQARQRATEEIQWAKENAVNEVHAQAAELATNVAGKILRRQINAQDQQQFVNEALAELGKGLN